METVLVTGGAGFIGSHTCKALAAHGFLPVAFDDLSRGHADFVRWGPLDNGDILDLAALDAAFERHRPRAVIHFAALAYVGESMSRLRAPQRGCASPCCAISTPLARIRRGNWSSGTTRRLI